MTTTVAPSAIGSLSARWKDLPASAVKISAGRKSSMFMRLAAAMSG
jgi:hypothetical protein